MSLVHQVRGALRKAGHTAMKSHTTRIRGWYDYTSGYVARERDGVVTVTYEGISHFKNAEETNRIRNVYIDKMMADLERFAPERKTNAYQQPIIEISQKAADEPRLCPANGDKICLEEACAEGACWKEGPKS